MTTYTSDTFTRADGGLHGSSPETTTAGALWVASISSGGGTYGVVSNKAQKTTAGGSFEGVVLCDSSVADGTVSGNLDYLTAGDAGVVVRGLDYANFNLVAAVPGGTVEVYTVVAGSYTLIASSGAGVFSNGNTYALSVVLLGTSIKVYVNGVLQVNTTSADNQSRTSHGLRFYNETVSRFDDYLVTDTVAADVPPPRSQLNIYRM